MNTTLRVAVQETVYENLLQRAHRSGRSPEYVAAALLQLGTQTLPDSGKLVTVTGETLEQLEIILGGGSVLNQADLLQKIERLAGVSFLHCRLPFTPNQLEQLADKAARQGLTVQQLVDRTAPRIYEQFFDLMARV